MFEVYEGARVPQSESLEKLLLLSDHEVNESEAEAFSKTHAGTNWQCFYTKNEKT